MNVMFRNIICFKIQNKVAMQFIIKFRRCAFTPVYCIVTTRMTKQQSRKKYGWTIRCSVVIKKREYVIDPFLKLRNSNKDIDFHLLKKPVIHILDDHK